MVSLQPDVQDNSKKKKVILNCFCLSFRYLSDNIIATCGGRNDLKKRGMFHAVPTVEVDEAARL